MDLLNDDWLDNIVNDMDLVNDDCLFSAAANVNGNDMLQVKLEEADQADQHDDLESFLMSSTSNSELLPSPDTKSNLSNNPFLSQPKTDANKSIPNTKSVIRSSPTNQQSMTINVMAPNTHSFVSSNANQLTGSMRIASRPVPTTSGPYTRAVRSGLLTTNSQFSPYARPARLIPSHPIGRPVQPQRIILPSAQSNPNARVIACYGAADSAVKVESESPMHDKSPSPPSSASTSSSDGQTPTLSSPQHFPHVSPNSHNFAGGLQQHQRLINCRSRSKMHELALQNNLISEQDLRSSNLYGGGHGAGGSSGEVKLSPEEKRTLVQEGYSVPTRLPLSKNELDALKIVRRKIKNKLSAQESRRKRKEYMDTLEHRMESCQSENVSLRHRVRQLEQSNRQLQSQIRKLTDQCEEDGSMMDNLDDTVYVEDVRHRSKQPGVCLAAVIMLFAIVLPMFPMVPTNSLHDLPVPGVASQLQLTFWAPIWSTAINESGLGPKIPYPDVPDGAYAAASKNITPSTPDVPLRTEEASDVSSTTLNHQSVDSSVHDEQRALFDELASQSNNDQSNFSIEIENCSQLTCVAGA